MSSVLSISYIYFTQLNLELSTCGANDLYVPNDGYARTIKINNQSKGKCFYRIRADNGRTVKAKVDRQNFSCETLCFSYVEVKYLRDTSTTGKLSTKNRKWKI